MDKLLSLPQTLPLYLGTLGLNIELAKCTGSLPWGMQTALHQYLSLSLQAPFGDFPERGALDESDWLSSLILLLY